MRSFQSVLQRYKTKNGLSTSEIARQTGVNRSLVAAYLNGANPTAKNRERMADGLLLSSLQTAGFKTLQCEECGTTFNADPRHPNRKFCQRRCNLRATARRNTEYRTEYELGRAKHDLGEHQRAVAKFCNWCAGTEGKCPSPRECPLASVSPLVYETLQT